MTNTRFTSSRYGEAEREMAQALVDLEARALDPTPAEGSSCKEGMFPGVSRRILLAGGASLGGAMLGRGIEIFERIGFAHRQAL